MEYLDPKLPELASCHLVLTIELDPQSEDYPQRPPPPLTRAAAERVINAIAADLMALYPGVDQLGLVAAGALYDQTELLRPGFPLLKAHDDIFRGTLTRGGYKPQLLALGIDDDRAFPVQVLNPARHPGSGPLFLLPVSLVGRKLAVASLRTNLENSLLDSGVVSEQTVAVVQEQFGVSAVNMSYATVNDLCALLKVQLENSGFEALWQLLEQPLYQRQGVVDLTLATGNRFVASSDGVVYSPFYTFDSYSQRGPGATLATAELAPAYQQWTQYQRQYAITLGHHGITVAQFIATAETHALSGEALLANAAALTLLDGDFLVESAFGRSGVARFLSITHQRDPAVGTIAYSVVSCDEHNQPLALEHLYPITADGVQRIIEHLKARCERQQLQRQLHHPDTLLVAAASRSLDAVGLNDGLAQRH